MTWYWMLPNRFHKHLQIEYEYVLEQRDCSQMVKSSMKN